PPPRRIWPRGLKGRAGAGQGCRFACGTGWDVAPLQLSSPKKAERVALRQAVLVGFDGVRDVQSQFLELRAQGPPGDAQQEGGPGLVPAGMLQDAGEQEPIHLPVAVRV